MITDQIIKLSDLNPGDNLLGIERQDKTKFTVWRYLAGHSVMIISLQAKNESDSEDVFYLCFEPVEYFDGPTRWEAAGLYISTREECAIILKKIKGYHNFPSDLLPLQFRLVKVNTDYGLQVRIIAAQVSITQDISSWLGDG